MFVIYIYIILKEYFKVNIIIYIINKKYLSTKGENNAKSKTKEGIEK